MGHFLVAFGIVFLGIVFIQNISHYQTKPFSLPERPALIGPLAPNNKFDNAKILLKNKLLGPESIVFHENAIYVTDHSGIVKLVDDKIVKKVRVCVNGKCGRPLGMRHWKANVFIVADGYLGIVSVNFDNDETQVLLSSSTLVNGKRINFADDFDFIDEDTIILSDASEWDLATFVNSLLELRGDGRVLSFNLKTKHVKLIAEGLQFANGVQTHTDKKSVLVCETGAARVNRFYITGAKRGVHEVFTDNLPCFPDNIRSNLRGTYFVACAAPRIPQGFSSLDALAPYPGLRKFLLQITPESWGLPLFGLMMPNYGIFVEIDQKGKIINSWHDTAGTTKMISQVTETPNAIYLGSYAHEFLTKIEK